MDVCVAGRYPRLQNPYRQQQQQDTPQRKTDTSPPTAQSNFFSARRLFALAPAFDLTDILPISPDGN